MATDWTVRNFYYKLIMLGYKVDNRVLVKYPDTTNRDGFDLVRIDDVTRDGNDIIIKVGGVNDGKVDGD